MSCDEARAGLWPPERPKLCGDDVVAARRHVDACPECAEYFAQDRALLDLYDRARLQRAPLPVRERVYDALSQARWARSARQTAATAHWARRAALPLVMVGVVATVFVAGARLESSPPDDSAMFVEDYLRRAVGEDHIVTNDAQEVQRFLQRELGVRVRPLHFEGLEITRAEICLLDGQRGAMIVYKKAGKEVSHYLVPQDGDPRAPALSAQSKGSESDAMPVIIWSSPSVQEALVGEIDSSELLRIARMGSSDY